MDRKLICAFLMKCEPESFMSYTDLDELGCKAVGPDGRKFIYTVEQLNQAEIKLKEALAPAPAKPTASASSKQRQATRRKPAKRKAAAKR
ncbi:MAG: hypothetical protein WBD62_06270 [Anaerolineales bacterium]